MRTLQQLQLVTLAVVAAACSNTDSLAPSTLNFNRPTDIAFACYGNLRITNGGSADPSQPIVLSAEPTQACDIRSEVGSNSQGLVPPGQEDLGSGNSVGTSAWYGFVLQSVPGTVGIATWATKPSSQFSGINDVTVLDADPLTPGKSGITMGVQPIGLVTSTEGCYEVTANAGSCDLSDLDITSALNYQANPQGSLSNNQPVRVNSMKVVNSAGIPIGAKPAAIVAQAPGGAIGVACPAQPTGLVYVAYPGCHLVAAIDLGAGSDNEATVVGGIQFDASGVPSIVDGTVTCPDECSGGAPVAAGPRPTSLDLEVDPNGIPARRQLAIGSENSNVVTVVTLDINSKPASLVTVPLQNTTGTLGVNQVKITPSIGMGGDSGFVDDTASPGPTMQFLYAITNDATIRVANLLASPTPTECDTQVDPRYLRNKKQSDIGFLSCMPVGGATTPPRRPGALGPGIELVNRLPAISTTPTTGTATTPTTLIGGNAAITPPMGLDIFRIDGTGTPATPLSPVGYYAVATGANGQTYMINIDDDAQPDFVGANPSSNSPLDSGDVIGSAIPLDIAHQVRDLLPDRGELAQIPDPNNPGKNLFICDTDGPDPDSAAGNSGGARSHNSITITLPTVPATIVSTAKVNELPSVRQVLCTGEDTTAAGITGTPVSELAFPAQGPASQGSGSDVLATRDAEYPDIMGMGADETWTLTYEGSVSTDIFSTAANGPPVRTGMFAIDATGMALVDQTGPFCDAGTQPFDIVQIHGCDPSLGNADCPPDYDCFVHPDSQVQGIGQCILSGEADRLANACREFLISQRRYTVGKSTTGKLVLLPRKHVLRTSPVDGCTSDAQCQTLANYALQNNSSANPNVDKTPPDTHAWSCVLDPLRAPDLDDAGNVIKRCVETCTTDTDCDAGTVCQAGQCMEGIEPPQSCVNAPEKYEIDVGEAYAVTGSLSGFHHGIIADANATCIQDPNGSPFNIGRLPLRAPACDPAADALGLLHDINGNVTGVEPNPCEMTVPQWEFPTTYDPTTCVATTGMNPVARQADAIVFRGPAFNLTLVDPTYPGDQACIGDRMGNLGKIPLMPTGGSMAVRVTGGFRPLFIQIQPALPGKVVRGPTNSIWVIDQGDFLSTSIDVASTSGKVFRVEAQSIGIINILE